MTSVFVLYQKECIIRYIFVVSILDRRYDKWRKTIIRLLCTWHPGQKWLAWRHLFVMSVGKIWGEFIYSLCYRCVMLMFSVRGRTDLCLVLVFFSCLKTFGAIWRRSACETLEKRRNFWFQRRTAISTQSHNFRFWLEGFSSVPFSPLLTNCRGLCKLWCVWSMVTAM